MIGDWGRALHEPAGKSPRVVTSFKGGDHRCRETAVRAEDKRGNGATTASARLQATPRAVRGAVTEWTARANRAVGAA